jgi:RES domain-containing protein
LNPSTSLRAWRIVKTSHAAEASAGEGARRYGGRWNSSGTAVIYCSSSASLAILEVLVHLDNSLLLLPAYSLISISFDRPLVAVIDVTSLPSGWWRSPPSPTVQRIGDAWVQASTSAVLSVPSAVVPAEHNYLLNPAHPDFERIEMGGPRPFRFDQRLLD